ncbi:high affinity copper uptake protein 1-like [Uloborus diversus]|uniref:high affinity copper uptake protein 1-like n=1 Tax=Uloborus diversus TaxID=327109 RepID=UPI00240A39BC|nr:high affinity copper uptake protein 1-like [Uloborus diversus]
MSLITYLAVCLFAVTWFSASSAEVHSPHHMVDDSTHRHVMISMDHDGHDMDMDDDMKMDMGSNMSHHMMMYFHFSVHETILFKAWEVTTAGGMVASVIGVFLMGMLYEGLKYFREYLFKQYVSNIQFSTVAITGESGRVTQVHKVERHRMLSLAHALQTALHVVQIIVSYFLMLIFMTYNVWLCLGVVFGAGVGYFIFGWKKASVVDITEHCH